MADLKEFRKANKLTQQQVADYLGIKKPFICKIETGRERLPSKHLQKLIDNPYGWVTEMLMKPVEIQSSNIVNGNGNAVGNNSINTASDSQLVAEIAAQRKLTEQANDLTRREQEQNRKSQEQIDRLLGIIEKLSNYDK